MRFVIIFTIYAVSLFAQRPAIDAGGVKNSASYTGGVRGLVTIFGSNLANTTETATTTPLPTKLGGTTVTVGRLPAFLLYVSPKQINVQLPLSAGPIVVTTSAGTSDFYPIDDKNISQVGMFTTDNSGCGQASAFNVSAETGATSINSRSNSASPGDFISLYGTGLYSSRPSIPVPDGNPAPSSPLYTANPDPSSVDFQKTKLVDWQGVAPGLIGVDQFNLKLDPATREGCAVPVEVFAQGTTRPVTIAVRKGGGSCVDPAPVGYGEILWERSSTLNNSNTTVAETLTASLEASPGRIIPAPPSYVEHEDRFVLTPRASLTCPVPGYRSLDAGKVTAQLKAANIDASVVPLPDTHVTGLTMYKASLPEGTIQPGQFGVSATGGAGAGSFQSSVRIGSGIQVTSDLANKTFPLDQPIVVNWTGGDPDTWVTVKMVGQPDIQTFVRQVTVRASDGTARIEPIDGILFVPRLTEIVVEVTPDPAQIVSLQASGLDTIRHSWKYSYHFPARQ